MKLALFLICGCLNAQQLGVIAHVGFKVADLERTRAFYSEKLGIPQAYDQKDASGKTTLAVFMINQDQFLEFSPGAPAGFTHVAFLSDKIEPVREFVASLGLNPPELRTGRDRTRNFSVQDPERHRIEFVEYPADSLQAQSRGKFPRNTHVSSISRIAIPYADEAGARAFLDRMRLEKIEIVPADKPFHLSLGASDAAQERPRVDPDGNHIEWALPR